ncbi:molybdopterin dinucleotide binding domain-containing protein [Variovorax sp. dw_308]|nr:molybdopterin dinucleotide binding domain-containing protein [Variovorax sp. dw_308]
MYEGARTKAQALGLDPPPFEKFWTDGEYRFPAPSQMPPLLGDFRRDPVANRLPTPSGKIEIFSARIDGYKYDDCPPHPTWLNPAEWLGSDETKQHPLHLLSHQPTFRLHSQLDHSPVSRKSKLKGRERITLHAADAAARGLADGDIVRVFNSRGEFLAALHIADDLMSGVAIIATGAWYDPLEGGKPGSLEKHGNPNVVTLDTGTSQLAQGSMVQTALVQIEKHLRPPPPVTAYDPPLFEQDISPGA